MSTDVMMATESTNPDAPQPTPHPLDTVSGALRHASDSLGSLDHGVGKRNMQKYGFFGRVAYHASYGLSYGLSYPAFMVTRVVPKDNAIVYGLTDGATAARDESQLKGITHSSIVPGHSPMPAPLPG